MKDSDRMDPGRSTSEPDNDPRSPFEKFEYLARRLVAVPKHEVDKRQQDER